MPQERAKGDLAAAERRKTPVAELRARFRGGRTIRRTSPSMDDPSPPASGSTSISNGNLTPVDENTSRHDVNGRSNRSGSDAEGCLVPIHGGRGDRNPVAICREHSRSVWLHFPHVELLFLFFAFEGAVGSQAAVLRDAGCPEVFYTALAALVSSRDYRLNRLDPVQGVSRSEIN